MQSPIQPLIAGLGIHVLSQISDERGTVLHMIRKDSQDFHGFGECYFSEILPGAVKAWKFHLSQTQNLAVPKGRVRLVVFDDREGSNTKGQLQVLELGRPDNYFRVTIPPRLWYGFSCISPAPAMLANFANIPHDPTESITIPADEAKVPYRW
jgi:dTDP-4-dehydrorhamnose 3,5-epimerase